MILTKKIRPGLEEITAASKTGLRSIERLRRSASVEFARCRRVRKVIRVQRAIVPLKITPLASTF